MSIAYARAVLLLVSSSSVKYLCSVFIAISHF
nr:MAG TPA: hypothetical protein [Caudoviricetes sp.]